VVIGGQSRGGILSVAGASADDPSAHHADRVAGDV